MEGEGQAFAEALLKFTSSQSTERRQECARQPILDTFPRNQLDFWTLILLLVKTYTPACQRSHDLRIDLNSRSPNTV